MILLNEIPVDNDTFIDGNLMLQFISVYEERSGLYTYKTPFIKWRREADDYRDFPCIYYLLRYLYRTGAEIVRLNIFIDDNIWSKISLTPCLGYGPPSRGCDWKITKSHIEDDPEYIGNNMAVYCYELMRNEEE